MLAPKAAGRLVPGLDSRHLHPRGIAAAGERMSPKQQPAAAAAGHGIAAAEIAPKQAAAAAAAAGHGIAAVERIAPKQAAAAAGHGIAAVEIALAAVEIAPSKQQSYFHQGDRYSHHLLLHGGNLGVHHDNYYTPHVHGEDHTPHVHGEDHTPRVHGEDHTPRVHKHNCDDREAPGNL